MCRKKLKKEVRDKAVKKVAGRKKSPAFYNSAVSLTNYWQQIGWMKK